MFPTLINTFDLIIERFFSTIKMYQSFWRSVWLNWLKFGSNVETNPEPALQWISVIFRTQLSSISYFRKVSRRGFYFLCLFPGMIFHRKWLRLVFTIKNVLVPVNTNHDEYHEKTLPQTFTIPLCFPVQQLRLLPKQTRERVSPHQTPWLIPLLPFAIPGSDPYGMNWLIFKGRQRASWNETTIYQCSWDSTKIPFTVQAKDSMERLVMGGGDYSN